jgi:hypothetical protein
MARLNLSEIWRYRDLLTILVERDIKLLHKQTALGVIWVVAQPLVAAVIVAVVFGRVAKLPIDGAPYLLFVFCGLPVWTYLSQALRHAGQRSRGQLAACFQTQWPREGIVQPLLKWRREGCGGWDSFSVN